MYWQRLGKIFTLDSLHPLMQSHSSNPTPHQIDTHIFRVFFSTRNVENKSSISFFDLDMSSLEIKNQAQEPLISFQDDTFYSHGISLGCIYQKPNEKTFLTFMGWHIPKDSHWMGYLGEMELNKALGEIDIPKQPIIFPEPKMDPISISYADIIQDQDTYYLFYGSTITWDAGNQEMIHVINVATSKDAEHWEKHGLAVPYQKNKIQAFSRPTIMKIDNVWHMWFSYRGGNGDKYKIGHAKTTNLLSWDLDLEKTSLYANPNAAWESEMVEYPYVFKYQNDIYMLYNGNSYGKTGIGLAKLVL